MVPVLLHLSQHRAGVLVYHQAIQLRLDAVDGCHQLADQHLPQPSYRHQPENADQAKLGTYFNRFISRIAGSKTPS